MRSEQRVRVQPVPLPQVVSPILTSWQKSRRVAAPRRYGVGTCEKPAPYRVTLPNPPVARHHNDGSDLPLGHIPHKFCAVEGKRHVKTSVWLTRCQSWLHGVSR
jgi:hypothetical protein